MVPWTLRAAHPGDAGQLEVALREGLESYRSFAPPGWEPPEGELDFLRSRLGDDRYWCLVAELRGEPAGHVSLMPAALHIGRPSEQPALGHLWQLFVRPRFWGSGLATELHTQMVDEAALRGFGELRLFTPVDHGRARRFYEREGWVAASDPFDEPEFGMALLEYRRPISISV